MQNEPATPPTIEAPPATPPSSPPPVNELPPAPDSDTPPPDTAAADQQVEEVDPSSLEELLDHLQIDAESVYKLPTTLKVNGKEERRTLAQLRESAQIGLATVAELDAAKAKARAIVDEATQQRAAFQSSVATFSKLVESVESEIMADARNLDQDAQLRKDDPAEYAARKQEIADRRERLNKMRTEAAQSYQQALAAQNEQARKLLLERLPAERARLVEKLPEWGDPNKASAEQKKVVEYMTSEGFAPADIQVASYNSAVLALAVKAMRYDESKGKKETVKKKVIRIPRKSMKPGPTSNEPTKTNGADADMATRWYGNTLNQKRGSK